MTATTMQNVELVPYLVEILHSVNKGETSIKDLNKETGRIRAKLTKLRESIGQIEDIEQTPDERKRKIDKLNYAIEKKKDVLQTFQQIVTTRWVPPTHNGAAEVEKSTDADKEEPLVAEKPEASVAVRSTVDVAALVESRLGGTSLQSLLEKNNKLASEQIEELILANERKVEARSAEDSKIELEVGEAKDEKNDETGGAADQKEGEQNFDLFGADFQDNPMGAEAQDGQGQSQGQYQEKEQQQQEQNDQQQNDQQQQQEQQQQQQQQEENQDELFGNDINLGDFNLGMNDEAEDEFGGFGDFNFDF